MTPSATSCLDWADGISLLNLCLRSCALKKPLNSSTPSAAPSAAPRSSMSMEAKSAWKWSAISSTSAIQLPSRALGDRSFWVRE